MNARTALVPVLVPVLLLTGCAAGQEPEPAAAPAPAASSDPAATGPAATGPAAPTAGAAVPTPGVRTVTVAYAGGEVTGTSGREEVRVGEPVVLRISSDVADQVHVHGYDAYGDLPAGGSVDVPLTADIPGVFEVELHDSGKVLFRLRVA